MEKEYMVVVYSKITDEEEYEYFDSKKESIKYAKNMADDDTITSVSEIGEDYEEIIWESE